MNPHILLKIENFVPSIYFRKDENTSKKITLKDESMLMQVLKTAESLNINTIANKDNEVAVYEELLQLARESDEFYLEEFADLNPENIEFEIESLMKAMTENAKQIDQEYKDVKMTDEAREAIDKNQKGDILASILDSVYLRLTAKALLAASELGIGEIHLQDDHKNTRLAEKMSKQMDQMGVEFVIE